MFKVRLTKNIKDELRKAQSFISKAERATLGTNINLSDFIRIEVINNCLHITVTNGVTQYFESSMEVSKCRGEGDVVIDSKMLFAVIGKRGDVDLEYDGNDKPVKFISKNSVIEIDSASILFPMIPDFENKAKSVTIPIGKMAEGFSKVNYAVYKGEEPARMLYTGVKVCAENGVMTFVATDGARVACATMPAKTSQEPCDVVIPQWLSGFICSNKWENEDAPAVITYDRSHIAVTVGTLCITSSRFLGQFSDMTPLISADRWWISVDAEDFKEVIREVISLMPVRLKKAGKTIFELNGTKLKIRSAQETGKINADIPFVFQNGSLPDEYINAYNPQYILDVLNALPNSTEKYILGFSSREKPVAIMSSDDPDCLCIISAVRFREKR